MSTLKADTIQNTSGGAVTLTKQSAAKAWARIDSSSTMAAQNSLNLSSLTDGGTGQVEMYFVTSFSDSEYAGSGMSGNNGNTSGSRSQTVDNTPATGNFHFRNIYQTSTNQDDANIMMSIHGDLA